MRIVHPIRNEWKNLASRSQRRVTLHGRPHHPSPIHFTLKSMFSPYYLEVDEAGSSRILSRQKWR